MSKRLSLVLPEQTVAKMDQHIDGILIKNRTHLLFIAVSTWLEGQETQKQKPTSKRDKKGRFIK